MNETVKDKKTTTNESNSDRTCPICKKNIPPTVNLSFHRMLHPSTNKPYTCDHCLYTSLSKEELKEHCSEKHPSTGNFICAVCGKTFAYKRALNKHKHIHAQILPYRCVYCDRGFLEYFTWRQHEMSHKTGKFECPDCKIQFASLVNARSHSESATCKTTQLLCCQQIFSKRMDYVDHVTSTHRSHLREYPCEFCGKLCAFATLLKKHEAQCRKRPNKNHSKFSCVKLSDSVGAKQKYKCSVCNKEYASYSGVFLHNRSVHLKILPYKCSDCSKAFRSLQALNDHRTLHTGEKPYACAYCPRTFSKRQGRREHQCVHTGERPFRCSYCSLTFIRRDTKVKHERRHTGEKPFKCHVCNIGFIDDTSCKSHMKKKHLPPYFCTFCDQAYMSIELLVSHKKEYSH